MNPGHSIPFPTLTTKRLVLRELVAADAADVLAFRGDPFVQQYDDPPLQTLDEALAFIEDTRQIRPMGKFMAWGVALKETNQVIGVVALWEWEPQTRSAELGYSLARAYWGQGLGQEAVRMVAGYGFSALGLDRIYAKTLLENERSVRLLERLGFLCEEVQHLSALYRLPVSVEEVSS